MDTLAAKPYSADDFRLRLTLDRGYRADDDLGDHTINPGFEFDRSKLRSAAVLIPIIDRQNEASVLLTKRQEKLRSHSGQVAFPGGRIDPTDASPEDAALRETMEEVGLDASHIEVIGRMPDYVSGSGFLIAPVFGVVKPGFTLAINDDEVEAAFEVPLRFLMDPANHKRDSAMWANKERFFYRMPFEGWMIWGVTAGIIRTVYERLYA